MGKLSDAAKKAAAAVNTVSSVVNGQCGHCNHALKNSRCPNGCLG